MWRRLALTLVLSLVLFMSFPLSSPKVHAASPCPVGKTTGYSVSGDALYDCSTNTQTTLRGFSQGPTAFNMKGSWDSGKRPSTDVLSLATLTAMKATYGAHTVRIPVSAYICNEDGCGPTSAYLTELDTVVRNALNKGLTIILCPFDDGQAGSPYTDARLHPEDITFLGILAARYKNDAHVLLDPINEPDYLGSLSTWENGCHTCNPVIDGYKDAIAAIRSNGNTEPIIISHDHDLTQPQCKNASGANVDRVHFGAGEVGVLGDSQLIYNTHWYAQAASGDAKSWSCMLGHVAGVAPAYIGEMAILPHPNHPSFCGKLTNLTADAQMNALLAWTTTGDGGLGVSFTVWNFEPVNVIQDTYVTWTPTTFNTGTWSCADGSPNAALAGDGTDVQTYLLAH